MSMHLTHDDLVAITDALVNLEGVQGITIHQISVNDHLVFLQKNGASKGSFSYTVVGITDKQNSHNPVPVTRSSNLPQRDILPR